MKKKYTRLTCLLLVLIMSTGMTMTAFAASPNRDMEINSANDKSLVQDEANNNIAQPASLPSNGVPVLIGDSADEARMVEVFHYQSGYRGPITIHVLDFNTSKYQVRIMVYGTDGLLFRNDDWMPNSNLQTINASGEQKIQAIFIGIAPRPKLLFQAPYKEFQVVTSW